MVAIRPASIEKNNNLCFGRKKETMTESLNLEKQVMDREYQWLLREEVHSVLNHVHDILKECCKRFPLNNDTYSAEENLVHPQKYLMSGMNPDSNVKCVVTLMGDLLIEADITVKHPKDPKNLIRTSIQASEPWRLQQIQDAGNHLWLALDMISEKVNAYNFKSGHETIKILSDMIRYISLARQSLVLPKRRTLEDLVNNRQMKSLSPPVPVDTVLSYYVQAQKLVLACYHLVPNNHNKWDISSRQQVECTVPWLNECILLLSCALQMFQQLRDKIRLFVGCEDSSSDRDSGVASGSSSSLKEEQKSSATT